MRIDGTVALVTSANSGLGQLYAREPVSPGERQRSTSTEVSMIGRRSPSPGVTPIVPDIADPHAVGSKAAAWSLANLSGSNWHTWPRVAVHAGIIDTDTAAGIDTAAGAMRR